MQSEDIRRHLDYLMFYHESTTGKFPTSVTMSMGNYIDLARVLSKYRIVAMGDIKEKHAYKYMGATIKGKHSEIEFISVG